MLEGDARKKEFAKIKAEMLSRQEESRRSAKIETDELGTPIIRSAISWENLEAAEHIQGGLSAMSDWIPISEAAKMLNAGSLNRVRRWGEEGKLEIREETVSLDSVQSLLASSDPDFLRHRAFQKALAEMEEAFGPSELTKEILDDLSWRNWGKLPWERDGGQGSKPAGRREEIRQYILSFFNEDSKLRESRLIEARGEEELQAIVQAILKENNASGVSLRDKT